MSAVRDIAAAVRRGQATPAAAATEASLLLAKADADGLNATLHWSPELLQAEARRVAAVPAAERSPAGPAQRIHEQVSRLPGRNRDFIVR